MAVFAQGTTAASSINEIKRQPDRFIFAENTASSFDEADSNARTFLTDAILNALDSSTPDRIETATRLASMASSLSAKRGNLNRIFLYIDRELLNIDKNSSSENICIPEPEPQVIGHVEPAQMNNLQEETVIAETPPEEETETTADSITEKMLAVSMASDIENFVKTLKTNGDISQYGRLKDMPYSGRIYIFIFNKNNEVVARLVKEKNKMTDIISGLPREINEFKGCGCIWMK